MRSASIDALPGVTPAEKAPLEHLEFSEQDDVKAEVSAKTDAPTKTKTSSKKRQERESLLHIYELRLGDPRTAAKGILRLLDVLLRQEVTARSAKQILSAGFGIPVNQELGKVVEDVATLTTQLETRAEERCARRILDCVLLVAAEFGTPAANVEPMISAIRQLIAQKSVSEAGADGDDS